jgi:hypothetical protein
MDTTEINFQELARTGKLNTIDPSLLTENNILIVNSNGITPLYLALHNDYLDQIPYLTLLKLKNECLKIIDIKLYTDTLTITKKTYTKELIQKIPQKLKTKKQSHV